MPELPDIVVLARSMNEALRGKQVQSVSVNQPKCLNLPPAAFAERVAGRTLESFRQRGKWVLAALDDGAALALNLGMGGEMLLHGEDETPDPDHERVVLRFADGDQLWIHHWWFGHVHVIEPGGMDAHTVGELGPEPLAAGFSADDFATLFAGRRGRIKSYLLDQRFIAGIGNVYVQDTLWRPGLHPERKASTLTREDLDQLYHGMRKSLEEGIAAGGGPGEKDVWGNEGRYMERIKVGYRTGEPCPRCGTTIEALRVGQTTSYICPTCQPLGH